VSAFSRLAWPSRGVAIAIGAFVAAGVMGISWAKCGDKPIDDTTGITTKVDEPLVPAPEALLADVIIGTPNASWGRLQRGIGGAVGILPASAGGIICAIAGLDPFLASEVDGTAAAFGAVAGDPANPAYLFAVKLVDLRKARAGLVDGETARFGSRDASGMTELLAKPGSNPPSVALGISPNGYLLIARASEDLGRLGPYVSRSLPRRAVPAEGAVIIDVPRAALGTLVKPKLDELWVGMKSFLLTEDERMRHKHGGRAPDFGDPKAIVAALDGWVTRRIAVISDLEKMRVAVDFADDGLSILTTMTPLGAGGPAATWTDAMTLGDTAPVASFPSTSAAALLVRDNEADRAEQAREVEKLVTGALGPRLAEADAKKLHDVVEDYTKARSDVLTAALIWDDPQGLVLRAPVRDADAAARCVRGGVDLVRVAPFKELLRARDVTTSTDEVSGLGKVSLATIARAPRAGDGKDAGAPRPRGDAGAGDAGASAAQRTNKDELGLAWTVDGGVLSLATGDVPIATLGAAVRPDRKLGDELAIARSLGALGKDANSVLVVQPLRFDPMRANLPPAPLVVALGRKDKNAVLRIDVANGLLRELTRWQLGL
jgi:hypothetical protein